MRTTSRPLIEALRLRHRPARDVFTRTKYRAKKMARSGQAGIPAVDLQGNLFAGRPRPRPRGVLRR
ncbi:hypothetical protein QJS66_18190 [Kocuria rhizophila]|nr:hypothetical protein QJS66_18190 [Kocuria rhizophila]